MGIIPVFILPQSPTDMGEFLAAVTPVSSSDWFRCPIYRENRSFEKLFSTYPQALLRLRLTIKYINMDKIKG